MHCQPPITIGTLLWRLIARILRILLVEVSETGRDDSTFVFLLRFVCPIDRHLAVIATKCRHHRS